VKISGFHKLKGALTNQKPINSEHTISSKIYKRENDEVVGWDEPHELQNNEDSIKDDADN
jgi:hypothetical protein